jgi:hypothetical protein
VCVSGVCGVWSVHTFGGGDLTTRLADLSGPTSRMASNYHDVVLVLVVGNWKPGCVVCVVWCVHADVRWKGLDY